MFPVDVAKEKSVGTLKKEIKKEKKQRLHDIDADALTLWWVSLRIVLNMSRLISFGRPSANQGKRARPWWCFAMLTTEGVTLL